MSTIALAVLTLLPTTSTDLAPVDFAPRGRYVEARTATVFAGACHYGSEESTAGREALLAWRFEGGRHAGVELAGVEVVAAIAGESNLAGKAGRRARLYVAETASTAQREAVRALLSERLGPALGTIDAVHAVPMTVAITPSTYRVESKGLFALAGSTLPDRACCKMPYHVWYAPIAPVAAPIVGHNDVFRNDDARLGRVWSRPDENASFTGAFRFARSAATAR